MNPTTGPWPLIFAIIAAVGGVGGLAGVVALINSRATRRKTYAEAEQIKASAESNEADAATKITAAATALVAPLQGEVGRLTSRVGQLESDAMIQRTLLVEHSVWDHLALDKLREHDVTLPPIPPLFPPPPQLVPETTVKVKVEQTNV